MGIICTEIKKEIWISFSSFIRNCSVLPQQTYSAMSFVSVFSLELFFNVPHIYIYLSIYLYILSHIVGHYYKYFWFIYIYIYIYLYILSSTDRLFHCITTLQYGWTCKILYAGNETRLTLRQSDILPQSDRHS